MKTKSEILEQAKEDLRHIPRGSEGSLQNYFRQMYEGQREHHIAKTRKTKEETFLEVWNDFKKGNPSFIPKYDPTYFKINSSQMT